MQIKVVEGKPVVALEEDVQKSLDDMTAELDALSRKIAELTIRRSCLGNIKDTLKGLADSWKKRDPGKYNVAYFFLDIGSERVVVRELLTPGDVFLGTQEELQIYLRKLPHWKEYDKVPPHYPVISFTDVLKVPCPECGEEVPLVHSYHQTYDGPDGDTWKSSYLVIHHDKVIVVEDKSSGNRMF